jgi:hypothetical protein
VSEWGPVNTTRLDGVLGSAATLRAALTRASPTSSGWRARR